jgi:hypothetical protein
VSFRVSYREDGAYLIRFESAILKDPDLPEDWRKVFAQGVHDLVIKCLEADDIKSRRLDVKKSKR